MDTKDFQWDLMVAQLRGVELNNFGLHQVAQLSCGEVTGSQTHDLLTQRLYEQDWRDRFLAK